MEVSNLKSVKCDKVLFTRIMESGIEFHSIFDILKRISKEKVGDIELISSTEGPNNIRVLSSRNYEIN